MKRTLLSLTLALAVAACASNASAPTGSTASADGAIATEGNVSTTTVNGMRVVVKRTPGAEFVAGQLYVLGGVRNWTAANAGVELLTVEVATHGGTRTLSKDAFAQKLAALGSDVGGASGDDYALFACKALKAGWDDTFNLLADAFLNPALPASELELARTQQLSSLRHEQEDPDGRLNFLVNQQLFAGHPYGRRAAGTLETIAAIKPEQLAAHLNTLHESSRLVWIVVGDVDPAHVVEQAKAAFGALPKGSYQPEPLPAVGVAPSKLFTDERKLPTNYVRGTFMAVGWKDAALPAEMVAMNILNERLFEEVRTKRNLSYAPYAGVRAASEVPTGSIYVTAVDANQTFQVMLDEVRKLQSAPVAEKELTGNKSLFLTSLVAGSETVDGQAGVLARALIYGGDWHLALTLPERIRAVTPADVQKFAQAHLHGLQTVVVGDPSKANAAVFQSL